MLLVVLILATFVVSTTAAKCPQPEFVHPCDCRPWETGIFVVCHQVNNTNTLRTVFQLLRDYDITRLLLKDCHLTENQGMSIFSGMNIKLLRLIDSSITRTLTTRRPSPIAVLAPYIDRLDITNCGGLLRMQDLSLGPLAKLKDLNVVRDNIGTLRKSHLPNPSNITNLRLEQCEIGSIEPEALSHISSLKSLTLSKNHLTTLSRDVLPRSCSNLLSIDLSENKISSLPTDFFNGMDNIHTINLYENQLQVLDQAVWSQVWTRLDKLWINGNELSCDRTLEWIFEQERHPPTLYGNCLNPVRLRGRPIAELTVEDLNQDRQY